MKIPEWFPWDWAAWKKSPRVMALSPVAKHAYRALLDSQWENGGKLPNQPKIFFKYADCTNAEWDSVAADVLQFFPAVEEGAFVANPRLAGEWVKTQARYQAYSDGGRAGNDKKWRKTSPGDHSPTNHQITEVSHINNNNNKDQNPMPDAGASNGRELADVVKSAFTYYLSKTGRNPKTYTLTTKRRDKGISRLKEFQKQCDGNLEQAEAMLRRAVDGICADSWDDRTRYREWESHLFGSQESAEKWRNAPLSRVNGKPMAAPLTNQNADAELLRQLGGGR